jgi:N-acetylglucosaminyldiphosphoundecaprenol N-acetyl-beta-D-mannosaminyltransferase
VGRSPRAAEAKVCANVLGIRIDAVDTAGALRRIESALAENRKGYVCSPDASNIIYAQDNPQQRRILNNSLLTIPDSRAVVWAAWAQGVRQAGHVGGPELMLEMCRLSQTRGYRHFFYGSEPGVAEELRKVLQQRFPGLNVVGTYAPPFRPLSDAERDDLIGLVASLKPDMFWVGISSPKQERFMAEYLPLLDTKLMFAVGAAFNFHTGRVRFSPHWVRVAGISWLFRLTQEPRRLWRRYLFTIPRFLWGVGLQLSGLRSYSSE